MSSWCEPRGGELAGIIPILDKINLHVDHPSPHFNESKWRVFARSILFCPRSDRAREWTRRRGMESEQMKRR